MCVRYTFVCPWGTNNLFVPQGTNISHTQVGGGDKQIVCPPGTNIFYTQRGGTNIFLMMMIIVGNVSGVNILSSLARKPPAGARILGL